jgi:F-box protein 11
MFSTTNLVVSQNHPECYQSISEAVNAAAHGATIQVYPGNYQENIVIDKPLKIVGEGERSNIVIIGTGNHCLSIRSDSCQLINLAVKHISNNGAAIEILQGETIIENCEISSDYVGILVDREVPNLVVQECEIKGGIHFSGNQGLIKDCDITAKGLLRNNFTVLDQDWREAG